MIESRSKCHGGQGSDDVDAVRVSELVRQFYSQTTTICYITGGAMSPRVELHDSETLVLGYLVL